MVQQNFIIDVILSRFCAIKLKIGFNDVLVFHNVIYQKFEQQSFSHYLIF